MASWLTNYPRSQVAPRLTNEEAAGAVGTVTSVATGTGLTGGPITGTGTVSLANTAVTPGSYTSANITWKRQFDYLGILRLFFTCHPSGSLKTGSLGREGLKSQVVSQGIPKKSAGINTNGQIT